MEAALTGAKDILGFVHTFAGGTDGTVATLAGQASTRRYHRVSTTGRPASCVVMELPADDTKVPEAQYPFLNLHHYLERGAYPVPRIYRSALAQGLIALEDLGDLTLERAVAEAPSAGHRQALYRQAIALITRLQVLGAARPDPACLAFGRRFDFALLRWELDHFREWLLEEGRGVVLPPEDRAQLDAHFDTLAQTLAESPAVLVHRDFQSRNLMVLEGTTGPEIRVIDFQDALLGPRVYDLVALLRDSYLSLPTSEVNEFIDEFSELTGESAAATRHLFHLQTLQRKLKDAGRFVFIDRKRGNPGFLSAIPLTLEYVRNALASLPAWADLHALLGRYLPELR
ncbi:MAG: phosphotransferase [Myxococcales bacterium]|nr:phosphotransferase [Myxococcales bacterium]